MQKLLPNTCYELIYKIGKPLSFRTHDVVPIAIHLIMVSKCDNAEEIELVKLLIHPWDEIVLNLNCEIHKIDPVVLIELAPKLKMARKA